MLRVFPLLECFLKSPKCSCNSTTRERRFLYYRALILVIGKDRMYSLLYARTRRRRAERTMSLDIYEMPSSKFNLTIYTSVNVTTINV